MDPIDLTVVFRNLIRSPMKAQNSPKFNSITTFHMLATNVINQV